LFEVEIKAYIDDLVRLERQLTQLGAIYHKTLHQSDLYLQHPIRNFAQTDEALRIRISNDQSYLTYKGPKLDSTSKTREELELEIEDPDKLTKLLRKLGFITIKKVVKTRRRFLLDDVIISIDHIEKLGYFIELELDVQSQEEISTARERLFEILKEINISKDKLERRSYLELLFLDK
jgi:adenylate cyclase class 2